MPLALTLALLAQVAEAQAPGSFGRPSAPPKHKAPAQRTPEVEEPGSEKLDPGVIKVRAESYEQTAKGHVEARGIVDLRMADMRIQADAADVYDDPQPDGSVRKRIVAVGNVVFIRGEERLAGDRLEMDDSGKGVLLNVVGYLDPGVFVEARTVERLDERRYRVVDGNFSSCAQSTPRWDFSATRAGIRLDDKITAHNAVFKVKGVPALYLPYVYYPISKEQRSSGLLMPSLGYSSVHGMTANAGFFWAMGRSIDQTFSVDYYSKLGLGLGHELRWMGASPSNGTLRTSVFRLDTPAAPAAADEGADQKKPSRYDYDIDWRAQQSLPGKLRLSLNVRKYSDLLYQQQFQQSWSMASTRSQEWSAALERDFGLAMLSASGRSRSTYFGDQIGQVNEEWPALRLRRFPRQVGWGGIVFGLDALAEEVRYGASQQAAKRWSRYDFAPTLSRPFQLSFLEINPQVGYRYTRYGTSLPVDEDGQPAAKTYTDEAGNVIERKTPPVSRAYFEASLGVRGPTFARVFDTPGFGYSERFKHTIGPEVSWTYRTRVDNFNQIPKFDWQDWSAGANELSYSLAQRFYAKRSGIGGKPMPYEFFSWRLMQTYYVQIREGQGVFDPNYASAAIGPGSTVAHLSRIRSVMRLRPAPDYSLDYQLEYDVNFKQLARTMLAANVMRPGVQLQATWTRSYQVSDRPDRGISAEMIRGNGYLELVPKRITLEGSLDYDIERKQLIQTRQQLRLGVQCCGITVEHIQYSWNTHAEQQWRFALELANVGSIGSFMGADLTGNRQGFGGYR